MRAVRETFEEVFALTERRAEAGTDPAQLYRQWYETGARAWSEALKNASGGGAVPGVDPLGFYERWAETVRDFQEAAMGSAVPAPDGIADPKEAWSRWADAATDSWEKGQKMGQELLELTPRWIRMLEEARDNLLKAEGYPKDPLEFAVRWYNATSGPYSEFVQDVIEREEFLALSSRWMQSYASLYKVFAKRSEEYLSALQLPVRSDITRVAGLVVALEDKVDRIEEAFEEFEYGYAKPATSEEVEKLEDRLDRVEGKLDRLIAALEGGSNNGSASHEAKATEAARRKARETGVDLAGVRGTGTDGQITVEDVRRAGEEG